MIQFEILPSFPKSHTAAKHLAGDHRVPGDNVGPRLSRLHSLAQSRTCCVDGIHTQLPSDPHGSKTERFLRLTILILNTHQTKRTKTWCHQQPNKPTLCPNSPTAHQQLSVMSPFKEVPNSQTRDVHVSAVIKVKSSSGA